MVGRCFLKQDHQGPARGEAHPGVVAAALIEAMALACGSAAVVQAVSVEFSGPAPVGTFLAIEAHIEGRDGVIARTTATATADDQRPVAHGRAKFRA